MKALAQKKDTENETNKSKRPKSCLITEEEKKNDSQEKKPKRAVGFGGIPTTFAPMINTNKNK